MKREFLILSILSLLFFGYAVMASNYKVDTKKSGINWVGEKVTGKHNGTVNLDSGELKVKDGKFFGEFTIDMTSITNQDIEDETYKKKLESHLKSDDFFSVEKHPGATFKISAVEKYEAKEGETANHIITGKLTIKDITHEIKFPATISFEKDTFTATAKFTIDRVKWDVRYNSGSFFENLGDKLIYDDIQLELNLTGHVVKAASDS